MTLFEEGDNGTAHDIIDVMFDLLDENRSLQDVLLIVSYPNKNDLFNDINNRKSINELIQSK